MNYPIGTNDFQKLFQKPFDSDAFQATPQFLFMGKKDDNDAIQYADAYDKNERDLIYKVIGKEMQSERWPKCLEVYKKKKIKGTFKSYQELGHGYTENTRKEILDFIKLHLYK